MKKSPNFGPLSLLLLLVTAIHTPTNAEVLFSSGPEGDIIARNSGIRLVIDRNMGVAVDLVDPEDNSLTPLAVSPGSGYPLCAPVLLSGRRLAFRLIQEKRSVRSVSTAHGRGQALTLRGRSDDPPLDLEVTIELYDKYPNSALLRTTLACRSNRPVKIDRLALTPSALTATAGTDPDSGLWAFQGGSYYWSQDYIAPLTPGTAQENFQGMNQPGTGGGVPLTAVWGRDGALALSMLSVEPSPAALPVRVDSAGRSFVWIEYRRGSDLERGDSLTLPPVQITTGEGDFFDPVRTFALAMVDLGLKPPPFPEASYHVPWCTWGLGTAFTPDDISGRLGELKKLGIKVVTVDAGWYHTPGSRGEFGDWEPSPDKFPDGEKSIRELIEKLHKAGFTVRLWWSPFSAKESSRLFRDHPDWFVRDETGEPVEGAFEGRALCPAHPAVKRQIIEWTQKMIGEWGFDGFKIDGTGINFAPPCYSPEHGHQDPWDSSRALPELYRAIYETATAIKPDAVIEVCPCGIVPNFYHLPYYNLPVTADPAPFFVPKGIWQARVRAKFLKALFGPRAPVHMDYVEWGSQGPLTFKDFASQVGVGGVVATMYAEFGAGYQVRSPETGGFRLPTAQTCAILPESARDYYRQWIALYHRLRLYDGEYLNLYDVALDYPETHVIARGDTLHYGLFTAYKPGQNFYTGPVRLRGLKSGVNYRVIDSIRNMEIGRGSGPEIELTVQFADHLLLQAQPASGRD